MPTAPRKRLLLNVLWGIGALLMLCTVYVLSYPIALRIAWERNSHEWDVPASFRIYRPIDIVMDRNATARDVMCDWADCVNIRGLLLWRMLQYRKEQREAFNQPTRFGEMPTSGTLQQ